MPNRVVPLVVDFFHVEGLEKEGAPKFADVLEGLAKRGAADRTVTARGAILRYDLHHQENRRFEGDMVRLVMDQVPGLVSMNEEGVSDIPLEDDQGIGEEAAFLYHAKLNVVALQRNRSVSASMAATYFANHVGEHALLLHPILMPETMKRLNKMKGITRLEVDIAAASGTFWGQQNLPLKELAKITAKAEAPNISITLKTGYNRGSLLNAEYIKEVVRGLLGDEAKGVRRLRIGGELAPDETVVLDLLKDRMHEYVTATADDRRLRYSERRAAVAEAFSRRRKDLEELYASDGLTD